MKHTASEKEQNALYMQGVIALARRSGAEHMGIMLLALEGFAAVRERMMTSGAKAEISAVEEGAILARYDEISRAIMPRLDKVFARCIGNYRLKRDFCALMCAGTARARLLLEAEDEAINRAYEGSEGSSEDECAKLFEEVLHFESGDLQQVVKDVYHDDLY